MKHLLILSTALALCASPLAAQPYRPYHRYDPGRGFETMLGVIITNALRPQYQPPLLPYYPPQPYVLNMRVVPNGPVLTWLYPGDQILIDGASGPWAHVVTVARLDLNGGQTQGWVFGPYLVPCGPLQ